MSALSLTSEQISVSLEIKEGELRIDSRIISDGFGLKSHKDYRNQVLEKYESKFAELGVVLKHPTENGEIVWYLNQAQVNFAGTLARNTEKSVEFKLNLVKAFEFAKTADQRAPISVTPTLQLEQAEKAANHVVNIQALLGVSNPRLAQLLIDVGINHFVESTQPSLPASSEFPEDKWYGIVQIADKIGVKTNASTRVKLGNFVGKKGLERVRESRLCNGMMAEIWCYRDDKLTRSVIEEFANQD
jgi:phage regulator Rha-like protein